MGNRKSCVIYDSWAEMLVNMPDETAGELIKNMMRYIFDKGDTKFNNPEVHAMFCMIKEKLDVDSEKYQAKVDRASKLNNNRDDIATKSQRNRDDIASVSDSVSVSDSISPTEIKKHTPARHKRGEYGHVLLSDADVEKLKADYGDTMANDCITYLDEYMERKGYKAKNHYLTIKKWVVDAVKKEQNGRASPDKFDPLQYMLNKVENTS